MDKTKIAVEIFNKYAEKYQGKFMNVDLYKESFDAFCETIKKQNASILELACGPGNITKYLLSKRTDFKLLGTDLAPNMIELAKVNNPTATFQMMDCRDLLSLKQKFDGIVCGFCFPYLSKEEAIRLIADSTKALNENGVIYISTMEDDYSKSGFEKGSAGDEIFMHYHQADYLTEALLQNNFTIVDLQRKVYTPEGKATVNDLMIVAKRYY